MFAFIGSGYGPIPSPTSTSSRIADGHGPPPHMATLDQYLPWLDTPFGGESSDSPLLPRPLTPQPLVEVMVVESTVDCVNAEPVAVSPPSMPDLSREGPFDVHEVTLELGASPRVLDSLPGCQYWMTSYDVENDRSDFSPAYGIHILDPRLLEYVGAPESAHLLSRTPEFWLPHMGREKTLAAALQLQHDTGLIMSNIQVLGQFVTSLNRMASEVMRVAFDREPFPLETVQYVTPSHCVRQVAHYMAAMGLWHPPSNPGVPGPLSSSSCNVCMSCLDYFRTFRSSGGRLFMWCTLHVFV